MTTTHPEADETEPRTVDPHRITLTPYDHRSEYDDEDAKEEEVEEESFAPPNPTTVPTQGYRQARDGTTYPPDSRSPEPMELETGEPDDFPKEYFVRKTHHSEFNLTASANSDLNLPS